MRIGLVTDVHNDASRLRQALNLLRERDVDRVVALGDLCDAYSCSTDGSLEVAELLSEFSAEGVWGNHDFSLCHETPTSIRARFAPGVLEVMGRMQPRMVIGPCHFSHRESSVDPLDAAQLWDLEDPPSNLFESAKLAFAANSHPWQFVGHYHRWWAATPEGPLDWSGERPLNLDPSRRYFVVVGPVLDGACAVLDLSESGDGVLQPLRFGAATSF